MKVIASRKYHISDDGEYQLTDCRFDEEGRKMVAKVFNRDGSLSFTSRFDYFDGGYVETARLPSGRIKYISRFTYPELSFFREDNSLICKFIMNPDSLVTEHYDPSGRLTGRTAQRCSLKEDNIDFHSDDPDDIYGEVYRINRMESAECADLTEYTSGNKRRLEYYSVDRKTKMAEFYIDGVLCHKHRTEIEGI